jgi:hypothetical protein
MMALQDRVDEIDMKEVKSKEVEPQEMEPKDTNLGDVSSENLRPPNRDPIKLDLVKRCPACNEENPVSEVICRVCMTNLASVSPTPRGEVAPDPISDTLVLRKKGAGAGKSNEKSLVTPAVLTFSRLSDGRSLPVSGGGVLGRNGDAGAFFSDSRTVSRRHAKVDFRGEAWWIEDLNSTNGTWVNGSRLDPGRPHLLKKGDTVALSLACEMRVVS